LNEEKKLGLIIMPLVFKRVVGRPKKETKKVDPAYLKTSRNQI